MSTRYYVLCTVSTRYYVLCLLGTMYYDGGNVGNRSKDDMALALKYFQST